MGIKKYKQQRAPTLLGFMSRLGVGLRVGLGISLIATHIFALYSWIYLVFIDSIFATTYLQFSEQKIRSSRLAPEIMGQQLANLTNYADVMSNNFTQSMVMFVTVFNIELLFSLISALVYRTP